MGLTIEQIAHAISGHDFQRAYPYLADDVLWNQVGEARLSGKGEVIGAFERSAAYLAGVATDFHQFRSLVASDWVVIESLASYTDEAGAVSMVASCDIYDFRAGKLSAMSSYNVEVHDSVQ